MNYCDLMPQEKLAVKDKIMQLLVQGFTDAQIADQTGVTRDAVAHILRNQRRRYKAPNRVTLVLSYMADGVRAGKPCPFCILKRV